LHILYQAKRSYWFWFTICKKRLWHFDKLRYFNNLHKYLIRQLHS
jgi:hypothetical protein